MLRLSDLRDIELAGLLSALFTNCSRAAETGLGELLVGAIGAVHQEILARGRGRPSPIPIVFCRAARLDFHAGTRLSALLDAMTADLAENGFRNAASLLRESAEREVVVSVPNHLAERLPPVN